MKGSGVTGDLSVFVEFAPRIFAGLVIRHPVARTKLPFQPLAEIAPQAMERWPIEPGPLCKLFELRSPVREVGLQAATDGSSIFGLEAIDRCSYALTNKSAAI